MDMNNDKSRPYTPDQQPPQADRDNQPKDKNLNDISEENHKDEEEEIDKQLEQTFPASDPPSYSQPGNEDIKDPAPETDE